MSGCVCGVDVVCVQSARGGRDYVRYGKCVVSAVCERWDVVCDE